VDSALFVLADGRVGVAGTPLASHPACAPWAVVAGCYVGRGPDSHLAGAPLVLHQPDGLALPCDVRRILDLRAGVVWEQAATIDGTLRSVRFCSLHRPGTVVLRAHRPDASTGAPLLQTAPGTTTVAEGADGDTCWVQVAAEPDPITVAAHQVQYDEVVDRVTVYRAGGLEDPAGCVAAVLDAADAGFDRLLAEHRRAWAARWEDADIRIEGDPELQQAIRFSLFHLMASVADGPEAAVGARGLTGPGYRGHVFWDADTFTLPFLAATHPASARAMLEYRIRRLPAALAAARKLHREGARFPWESAVTGEDVTPTSARDRSGQLIPIRTGQLEEHIVAQVAWAACCYADWTGDEDFIATDGLELLAQTARYWASRVRCDDRGAHLYGVIGPDEYHEPVDDNAFTNVMARWNLRRAAHMALEHPEARIPDTEVRRWLDLADLLVDGYDPHSGIYEQFAGFHDLEPLVIAEVAPRRPIAADLWLGRSRVDGAQVLKQADVLMLHHLVPDEVEPDSLEPNLRFYEPRTAHGSSLSPGVHAGLFARARNFEQALASLHMAARMDLDDLTGSTAAGLHLATMGSVWQALSFGFAGLRPSGPILRIDPRLPPQWPSLDLRVRFRGDRVVIRLERDRLTVTSEGATTIAIGGDQHRCGRGPLRLVRRHRSWQEET
jgi:trehalose/maltose hydrolase-like predicted phosphorylase